MSKAVFIFTILLFLICVASITFYNLGLLPQSAYRFLYGIENTLPFTQHSAPYLEKFQGYWTLTLTPDAASEQVSVCKATSGTISVNNGDLSGTLAITGSFVGVDAMVASDGSFMGQVTAAGSAAGSLQGQLVGSAGTGTWKDTVLNCQGQLGLTKLEPVIDPVAGRIVSFSGNVNIQRGTSTQNVSIDESIYPGDIITAGSDGEALLGTGSGFFTAIKIDPNTSYTVPNVAAY
jgi:hypothetical protein